MVAALACLALLLSAAKCDKPEDKPLNPPKKASDPNPAAQPEAPAADPGPQNTEGQALLVVTWLGERSGYVQVYVNGKAGPGIPAGKPVKAGGSKYYTGRFERAVSLSGVTMLGVSWSPSAPGMPAQCTIQHNGLAVGYQGVNGGPCAANWTVVR